MLTNQFKLNTHIIKILNNSIILDLIILLVLHAHNNGSLFKNHIYYNFCLNKILENDKLMFMINIFFGLKIL